MSSAQTVADLLQICAGFEQRALELYRYFAQVFANHQAASRIWRAMSDAEAGHFAILRLAEDRVPPHDIVAEAGIRVGEGQLAEWKSAIEKFEMTGRRPGLTPAEAAEVTLTWELEEVPRLLTVLSFLPQPARRLTVAGLIEGADEHLECLRELLKVVGSHSLLPEVSQLEESVMRLKLLAGG